MSDRPLLFISAVSTEHRSLRGTIAGILDHEGYDTDFQEVLGMEHGDIAPMLMRHVDACDGVIQLIGQRYGFAPPAPHPPFGECSYTQFEALYARSIGKPVRYILLDPAHPSDADPAQPEPTALQALQVAYRQRIQADTALYHRSSTLAETENCIYRLRPVLEELRREWHARMDRLQDTVGDNHAILQRMEKTLAELAKDKQAEGKKLSDFPREDIMAELARQEGISLRELQHLLAEATASADLSTRAQALMIEQQFPEAAKLSRQAGDAKAERLKAMQARTAALAEEAALDYRREGDAHFYQLHYPPAITAYETALAQLTRTSHPETWAMLQNDLAVALSEYGVRTDPATGNQVLARAVSAYRAALEVYTREALPQDWAMTQNNLANALREQGIRSEGQVALDLLGQAVRAYRDVLEVYTREALPQDWAMTQNNLGNALSEQGSRSERQAGLDLLGQAVTAYRAALEVYTRPDQLQDWAMTQNNLANALSVQDIRSEGQAGLDLLGQAVTAYRAVLEVYTREALPQDWAMTQNNLANALSDQGERSEGQAGLDLLGQAVAAYRAALEVRTREALPLQWATTQNNLGSTWIAQGDRALVADERQRLYREAEVAYLAALEVRTKEALPYDHQQTQGNLDRLRARMAAAK